MEAQLSPIAGILTGAEQPEAETPEKEPAQTDQEIDLSENETAVAEPETAPKTTVKALAETHGEISGTPTSIHQQCKDYLEEDDVKFALKELVEKYQDEIIELCKFDKDTKDSFGFVNTWWVFGEVAKELNYSIFMAEVDHVGYKRTKRGEKPMPNDLFRLNADGEIIVDDGIKETALDFLRDVKWD